MFISYVSPDEVNQDLAARLAEERGVTLVSFASLAEMPLVPYPAVIYDVDYLTPEDRQRVFDELTGRPLTHVAGVHSYNLHAGRKKALRRNGVAVHRRLQGAWFGRLVREARKRALPAARMQKAVL